MQPADAPGTHLALAVASAVALALVHLFAGQLRIGAGVARSRWLSLAGGVSVAYVFVHLLPEVRDAAGTIETYGGSAAFAAHYGYLIALLGFVTFYGLEQLVGRARADERRGESAAGAGLFWLHTGSFAVYNGIVGFLLLDRELGGLGVYGLAMALHFLVTDEGLRRHHGETYDRRARWWLSAAVLAGFVAGYATDGAPVLIAVFVPFLAGGVILNTIKEELPSDRESRFWAFAAGATGYAALLLFV